MFYVLIPTVYRETELPAWIDYDDAAQVFRCYFYPVRTLALSSVFAEIEPDEAFLLQCFFTGSQAVDVITGQCPVENEKVLKIRIQSLSDT